MTKRRGDFLRAALLFALYYFFNKSTYRGYPKNQDQLNFSDKTFRNLLNNGWIN
ncbi:hypothetical protein ABNN70_05650 [Sporolactobacillus sp. Y61]|uniref:Uncharacterized protein n=1 Tax=Sporolactobacillus sp. Y61 TaxID=3160863 RepID=A0AAU8IHE0_9BACL